MAVYRPILLQVRVAPGSEGGESALWPPLFALMFSQLLSSSSLLWTHAFTVRSFSIPCGLQPLPPNLPDRFADVLPASLETDHATQDRPPLHIKTLLNVRMMRGADTSSDHHLLIGKLPLKLRRSVRQYCAERSNNTKHGYLLPLN